MTTGTPSATVVPFPKSERQRAHAARMFAWEDQVRKDSELTKRHPHALHIVVLFRKRMNQLGETPRMEYGWIAKTLGIGRNTVRAAIEALIERDHLGKESGKSVGRGSFYKAKVWEGSPYTDHLGWPAHGPPGSPSEGHRVARTRATRISSIDSSLKETGGQAINGMIRASGKAASGYRGKQAERFERKTDGAVAERSVSRMLGRDGDNVLAVLFGSEEGRPLYNQLIETARIGGVNAHLIKKARTLYWELTPSRSFADAAQRHITQLQAEIDEDERIGTIIDGEAIE